MTPLRLRLAELRQARGLNQTQLAELAGVRRATVNELEAGKRQRIDLDILERLANALGVEPGAIIEREPAKRAKGKR